MELPFNHHIFRDGSRPKQVKYGNEVAKDKTIDKHAQEQINKNKGDLFSDGLDLFSELNFLKEIIGLENDKQIEILNYIKRINYFPNAYIAYRIILTILVFFSWKKFFKT